MSIPLTIYYRINGDLCEIEVDYSKSQPGRPPLHNLKTAALIDPGEPGELEDFEVTDIHCASTGDPRPDLFECIDEHLTNEFLKLARAQIYDNDL